MGLSQPNVVTFKCVVVSTFIWFQQYHVTMSVMCIQLGLFSECEEVKLCPFHCMHFSLLCMMLWYKESHWTSGRSINVFHFLRYFHSSSVVLGANVVLLCLVSAYCSFNKRAGSNQRNMFLEWLVPSFCLPSLSPSIHPPATSRCPLWRSLHQQE